MTALVHLKNETWSLAIKPDKGGCVVSGECLRVPIFQPANRERIDAGDVFASSCFTLVPFSNRIEKGVFSFKGEHIKIQKNHHKNAFPIHGHGWEKIWQVDHLDKTHCTLSLTYRPDVGGWPWAFDAQQKITIDGKVLKFQLSIKNIDRAPFPTGLGLHPSFANANNAWVKFSAGHMWACDDQLIPTMKMKLTPQNDFSLGKKLYGLSLDNCFERWKGHAELIWPELSGSIHMDAGPEFSNLVVYIDPENDLFCLEPVTHINNALNMDPPNSMAILDPGMSLSSEINFSYVP